MKQSLLLLTLLITQPYSSNATTKNLNIAVFCSADDKACDSFKNLAYTLGIHLEHNNFGLVTGGSRTGLMKEVIDGYSAASSTHKNLYSILPEVLQSYNVQHPLIPVEQVIWIKTMHARLETFQELSDLIIILPGGFGTLHELIDFLVHNQFSLSKKAIILLNYNGYWDNLLALFQTMVDQNLLSSSHKESVAIATSLDSCIEIHLKKPMPLSPEQGLSSHYWKNRTR